MSSAEDRFQSLYEAGAPWVTGHPQPAIVRLVAEGMISGPVLDCGCGTGENSVYLAAQGLSVTAFDFLREPLVSARRAAERENVQLEILQEDALNLARWNRQFQTVIDCGLYHVFPPEPRKRYINGLLNVCAQGGQLFILCFSENEPGEHGPLRLTQADIRSDFHSGWTVRSIQSSILAVAPNPQQPHNQNGPQQLGTSGEPDPATGHPVTGHPVAAKDSIETFSAGGAKCWLAHLQRD